MTILEDKQLWQVSLVYGSQLHLVKGEAGTLQSPQGHPVTSFSGTSTAIIGSATNVTTQPLSKTIATWNIPLDAKTIRLFQRGFLVIGCRRYFGGLHSKRYDARVELLVNNKAVDGFGLRIIPENHSDYFHRMPTANIPSIWPFSDCQTLYAWPLLKENMTVSPQQSITISIDANTWWDIDYVGLLSFTDRVLPHVFLSHNWKDKDIARKLAHDLISRGINVWLDEAEIKLGDSLIEKIREGIDSVDFLIVLLSKSSTESEWVKKEVDIAMNQEIDGKRVKVLPILLEDCDLPGFLKGKLYADLRSHDKYDVVLAQIISRVGSSYKDSSIVVNQPASTKPRKWPIPQLNKIWQDPVWSKVIAAFIVAVCTSVGGLFLYSTTGSLEFLNKYISAKPVITVFDGATHLGDNMFARIGGRSLPTIDSPDSQTNSEIVFYDKETKKFITIFGLPTAVQLMAANYGAKFSKMNLSAWKHISVVDNDKKTQYQGETVRIDPTTVLIWREDATFNGEGQFYFRKAAVARTKTLNLYGALRRIGFSPEGRRLSGARFVLSGFHGSRRSDQQDNVNLIVNDRIYPVSFKSLDARNEEVVTVYVDSATISLDPASATMFTLMVLPYDEQLPVPPPSYSDRRGPAHFRDIEFKSCVLELDFEKI